MTNKLLFFLIAIIIASCANPQPPSGGPPDKTPPEISYFEPSDKTINFDDDYVRIKFNKYMDHNSVIENLFISPSTKLDFDWSGKSLKISFDEKLDTNTTYSLTLGTECYDIKQNKPAKAFNLVFSTGSKIDTGFISGTLYDAVSAGSYIFAYRLDGLNPDTLDPRHTKPSYRTQIGSSGLFELKALKNGIYRIAAVRDQYKDEIFDDGIDAFSSAQQDFLVPDTNLKNIKLKIGKASDNTGPMLYEVESLSNRMITASFSENLDTASVSPLAFEISDSAGNNSVPVLHAFLSSSSATKVNIILAGSLDTNKSWRLSVKNDSSSAIRDSSGNFIQDTSRNAKFFASSEKDTNVFRLTSAPFPDSAKSFNPLNDINFVFSIPFEDDFFRKRITFLRMSDSSAVDFKIVWKQDNIMQIAPLNLLQSESWYRLTFKMDSLKTFSGNPVKDSTVTLNFRTEDIRAYSTISGIIQDTSKFDGDYLVHLYSKEKKVSKFMKADQKKNWIFENVSPGNYSLEVLYDSNKNGRYDYGTAFPFSHSERFYVHPGELTLKARWKLENYLLDLR